MSKVRNVKGGRKAGAGVMGPNRKPGNHQRRGSSPTKTSHKNSKLTNNQLSSDFAAKDGEIDALKARIRELEEVPQETIRQTRNRMLKEEVEDIQTLSTWTSVQGKTSSPSGALRHAGAGRIVIANFPLVRGTPRYTCLKGVLVLSSILLAFYFLALGKTVMDRECFYFDTTDCEYVYREDLRDAYLKGIKNLPKEERGELLKQFKYWTNCGKLCEHEAPWFVNRCKQEVACTDFPVFVPYPWYILVMQYLSLVLFMYCGQMLIVLWLRMWCYFWRFLLPRSLGRFFDYLLTWLAYVVAARKRTLIAVHIGSQRLTADMRAEMDRGEALASHDLMDYQLYVETEYEDGSVEMESEYVGLPAWWYKEGVCGTFELKTVRLNAGLLATMLNRRTLIANRDAPELAVEASLRLMQSNPHYQEDYQRLLQDGRSVYRDMALVCGTMITKNVFHDDLHF